MNKRTVMAHDHKIAVDVKELMAMLSCGRNTADKVGETAGAVIRIGNRKLYNVKKVESYIDSITGQEA